LVRRLERELVVPESEPALAMVESCEGEILGGLDFAFLPELTETPLLVCFEKLRSMIEPPKGVGPASPSVTPGNSGFCMPASAPSTPPCGDVVPEAAIDLPPLVLLAPADEVPPSTATTAHSAATTASTGSFLRMCIPPVFEQAASQ
jgi:hypothetical protein